MQYTFLTSDDLAAGIKDEQLTQIIGTNLGLIALAEASAVSWMQDYLGQRFDIAATFPAVGEWAANNDYGPALAILLPTADPGYCPAQPWNYLVRPEPAVSGTSYTPPYAYNPAGRLTNYAYHEGDFYQALANSLAVEPGVTTGWQAYWRVRDPRDQKLIGFAVDITLFNLFKRVAPRRIPELRISLYNQAKEWLTLVRDGNLTPSLPKPVQVADSSDEIRWGSNAPQGLYY